MCKLPVCDVELIYKPLSRDGNNVKTRSFSRVLFWEKFTPALWFAQFEMCTSVWWGLLKCLKQMSAPQTFTRIALHLMEFFLWSVSRWRHRNSSKSVNEYWLTEPQVHYWNVPSCQQWLIFQCKTKSGWCRSENPIVTPSGDFPKSLRANYGANSITTPPLYTSRAETLASSPISLITTAPHRISHRVGIPRTNFSCFSSSPANPKSRRFSN